MPKTQITIDNHYVPESYLKRWAADDGRVWTYRILVSNVKVPLWERRTPGGIAYHQHLYTRIAEGAVTDDVEKWLDREYENPAKPVIDRVLAQKKLNPDDWSILIRYMACQDVRTPTRLLESLKRQEEATQDVMQGALEKVKEKLEQQSANFPALDVTRFPGSELLPLNISTRDEPESNRVQVEVRTTTGRSAWLFGIRYILQNSRSIKALLNHQWTILRAPESLSWCTSDNPVVRLNYYSEEQYDFKGGWGSKGSEIIFPLDPKNIMYTRIGEKPPLRGTVVSLKFAHTVQRLILENAHRFVFCQSRCADVVKIRPRTEDASIFSNEQAQWLTWHEKNIVAESELQC